MAGVKEAKNNDPWLTEREIYNAVGPRMTILESLCHICGIKPQKGRRNTSFIYGSKLKTMLPKLLPKTGSEP